MAYRAFVRPVAKYGEILLLRASATLVSRSQTAFFSLVWGREKKGSGTMTQQILSRLPLLLPWLLIGETLYFTKVLILSDIKMRRATQT